MVCPEATEDKIRSNLTFRTISLFHKVCLRIAQVRSVGASDLH